MSRKSVRAIVIKDNKLLVMFRNKFGVKYVTLIGGSVEMGESLEQAVVRELQEETTLRVANPRLVMIDHADFYGDQYVFYCDYVSGEPQLTPDSPEASIHKLGKNLYEPGWLPLSELPKVPFLSKELQEAIISATTSGWANEVVEFSSQRNV
ncbi:MAG: NUDIX domain-containing protein [Candidatus Saccharimonadales bacterium]